MKKMIQISFLTGIVTLFCIATGYSQQRPSQRSYTSVMNEVKQKRAAHDKMIQQMKQTRPSNIILPSASTQSQPVSGTIAAPTTPQNSLSSPGTNQQPATKQINSQPLRPLGAIYFDRTIYRTKRARIFLTVVLKSYWGVFYSPKNFTKNN